MNLSFSSRKRHTVDTGLPLAETENPSSIRMDDLGNNQRVSGRRYKDIGFRWETFGCDALETLDVILGQRV